MNRLEMIIAEHCLTIDTFSDSIQDWLIHRFAAYTTDSKLNQTDMFVYVEEGYGNEFESFEVKVKMDLEFVYYYRSDFLIQAKRDYTTASIQFYNKFALNHAMMTLYSAFITHRGWGLMIHSSSVVDNGNAYLFTGVSGSGKSTAAVLSAPRLVLSDEAALAKITMDSVQIYNSPFRSDSIWNAAETTSRYELKSCYILRQSEQIKRIPIHKTDALMHLMNTIFYWEYSPEETAKVISLSRELINIVPFYELYFQKNALFWEEICEHSR